MGREMSRFRLHSLLPLQPLRIQRVFDSLDGSGSVPARMIVQVRDGGILLSECE